MSSFIPAHLSMPISVFRLLPNPVNGVEVLVGANARNGVIQETHKLGTVVWPPFCFTAAYRDKIQHMLMGNQQTQTIFLLCKKNANKMAINHGQFPLWSERNYR